MIPVNPIRLPTGGRDLAEYNREFEQAQADALVKQVVKRPFDQMSAIFTDRLSDDCLSKIPKDYSATCFCEDSIERVGDGLLGTLVEQTEKKDISSIVSLIMEAKKASDEELSRRSSFGFCLKSFDTYQQQEQLLTEVLISVQKGHPIDFIHKNVEEIRVIFELLDYLGLDEWQKELEKFLPPMSIGEMPETVFYCRGTQAQLPLFLLSRLRSLQYLKLEGVVSQDFLDSLPLSLTRLDLSSCDMRCRELTRKEIALAAIAQDGRALQYVCIPLLADKEVVLKAVTQDGWALRFASSGFQADKEVVLAAVSKVGRCLSSASSQLRRDKQVVLAAVAQDGWSLQYASKGLRSDKEVVLTAVIQDGWALRYACAALQGDKEVVLEAVTQDGRLLEYASAQLRNDPEVLNMARGKGPSPYTLSRAM
ncbi:MAG: DUF4116 domain-containing protein [Alphaproteobacteria bacterium]|nr:DUF4116 domain-containing protein [Alphaproteobacteria bacterium]